VKNWLFEPYFGSRYASKLIKGSEESDHSLVSKQKTWAKNGSLGWCPKPGKLCQKGKNIPPLWYHPQKSQI